jgi:hypothetical protein
MPKQQIDVYRDWLGIKETNRPLSYYQLLRLKQFEDNVEKIREHYRKMNAHVRKFATGEFAAESQQLLNELARAMLGLTDQQRKREYDASLGRQQADEGRRRTLEEILLGNKTLTQEQLTKARNFANAVGLDTRDAILQQKLATPEAVWLAYAESVGLPYLELEDIGVDENLVPAVPAPLARQHSFVPVMVDRGQLLVASPNPVVPDVEEELRLRMGMPVRSILCTPARINEAITKYYGKDASIVAAPVVKAAAAPAAAAPAAAPAGPALPPAEQMKRRGMFALIAFNITVVAYVFGSMLLMGSLAGRFAGVAAMAIVAGLVVAGITFVAAKVLKL